MRPKDRPRGGLAARGADGSSGLDILNRDGWLCKIPDCSQPSRVISRGLIWPDPGYPSIDHIVPWSQGGNDTAENKRAAHLHCNMSRGDRFGNEPVPLLGWDPNPAIRTKPCRDCGQPVRLAQGIKLCARCKERAYQASIPDDVHAKLAAMAAANHCSLIRMMVILIEEADRKRAARNIAAGHAAGAPSSVREPLGSAA